LAQLWEGKYCLSLIDHSQEEKKNTSNRHNRLQSVWKVSKVYLKCVSQYILLNFLIFYWLKSLYDFLVNIFYITFSVFETDI